MKNTTPRHNTVGAMGMDTAASPLLDEKLMNRSKNKRNSTFQNNSGFMQETVDDNKMDRGPIAPPADDTYYVENKTDKLIDFNAQLEALKKRTELSLPFTLTQVEDCMFLDQYNIVTLEYHYYQSDCKYTYLTRVDEHLDEAGIWVDSNGQKKQHLLGTEKYQMPGAEVHPMSAFGREEVTNYEDSHIDILETQRSIRNPDFMTVANPEKYSSMSIGQEELKKKNQMALRGKGTHSGKKLLVEAILAQYKVNQLGSMQRSHQVNVKMGRKFTPSLNGNMVLNRSKDKKVISLTNFDRNNESGEYFKVLAWTNRLKSFAPNDHYEILNSGINDYYRSVQDSFEELIELAFVGNSKFVMLVYLEAQQRTLAEQQLYEQAIDSLNKDQGKLDNFTQRQSPRKARRYVFFEIASGEVVLNYGGVRQNMKAKNSNNKEIEVFELGCLVKEIREEAFNPQLIFYFCGDFMDQQIKEQQVVFKWAMNSVTINMQEIFETEMNKQEFIQHYIRQSIETNQIDGYLNYYPFDENWILDNMFDWEEIIIPSATRKFDQVAMLCLSGEKNENKQSTFYVNGPKFKDLMKVSSLKTQNYILDVPYFANLPQDAIIRHSRNANIKDQVFYDVVKNNEKKTYCLRLDHQDQKSKVMTIKIPVVNFNSQPDIWLHYKKNFALNQIEEIFQSIHITSDDQTAILQTKLPKSMRNINSSDADDIVERRTNSFYQIESDSPCICYNLGDSKLVFQNTLQLDNQRKYILKLRSDEKFVCFVNFNQFEDIGFYPVGLRIECCSHFAFLTTGKGNQSNHIKANRLNLALIDPFYEETQVALFKSQTLYDNEIFQEGDTIIQSHIQSTMGKKRDLKFKTCIWTQFPQNLVRSTMMKMTKNNSIEPQDSDEDDESEVEDEEDISGKKTFEQVKFILSDRDFLYYITKQNGKCYIMEGNPRDQKMKKHEPIYTMKAERCLAFTMDGPDTFYFMDEQHLVYKLTRNENNRGLIFEKEVTMKEIQRLDFVPLPFDNVILNEKYAIQGSKIFYLYDVSDDPFPEGIFESEELIIEDRSKPKLSFSNGPISMKSSNRFFNIYQKCRFLSQVKIFQRPDTTKNTLINDFLNWVDMSSFLDDGKILVKIRRRFMVFTGDGAFIDEVEFNDEILEHINEETSRDPKESNFVTYATFKEKQRALHISDTEESAHHKLLRRRRDNPILDFIGNPYEFKAPPPPVPLSQNNKMELLQMSFNNKWYLFLNRMNNNLYCYELCEFGIKSKGFGDEEGSFFDFKDIQKPKSKLTYKFALRYDLKYWQSHLFQHMCSINADPIEYFKQQNSQIKIDDDGSVRLCFVEKLPYIDKQNNSNSEIGADEETEMMQCRLVGSIFLPDENSFYMKIQNFSQVFEFPKDAQSKMAKIIESKKNVLDRKINSIRMVQARLPKKYFDYSLYENLIEDLLILEDKRTDIIYSKIYCSNLVVVYCGQYVKFGFLVPNKKKIKQTQKNLMDFVIQKVDGKILTEMACNLSDETEVIKVLETANKNWLQLMTKEHDSNIFSIITWDFGSNVETNMFQLGPQNEMTVENQVCKGMNQKMNYFLNQYYLTDLEYNIPLRQTNVDQNIDLTAVSYNKQLTMIFNFYNQRKVFNDNSKFLGIERACCLYYPLSRMDLLLWQNINTLGEKPELIQQTCTLDQCNLVIDGISLFHYFADNSQLIEQIHNRYIQEKQNETLDGTDKTLPLQILNPDNNGKTALFLAVEYQCPQSFETMVNMLTDFPEQCLSKMMLKSISMIVSNDSSQVINFFELNIFQPPQMQIEQFIPWGEGMDEFVFASHTSIISKQLLLAKLQEEGIIDDMKTKKKKSNSVDPEPQQFLTARQQMLLNKKNLRPMYLEDNENASESDQQLRRVQIEALDLDWVFTGDNAKILLNMLATQANNSCLTKKSIRIFVDLMWAKYQEAIIKFIFVPYIAYLLVLSYLSGAVCGEFTLILYEDRENDEKINFEYQMLKIKSYTLTALATSLMICFGSLEMKQMWADGLEYFSDYWNCIDAVSLSINVIFLSMCTMNFSCENEFFQVELVRTFGAFSCFFMWIKVFYWMRLFSSLAYYVKLIQQTISDSLLFMLMVFLIILSFANFFYVIDRNLATQSGYFDSYTESPIRDVIISVYMMGALGDFDSAIYRVGYDRYFAIAMFLLATFIISVVFMNMLIAIMGETFGQVQEVSEESGLREQVVLIADHSWLLDPKKIFVGQKYIIRVQPSSSSQDIEDQVLHNIKETESTLIKRMGRLQNFIQKRVDSVDMNTRFLLKHQQISIEGVNRKLKKVEKLINGLYDKPEDDNLPEEAKMEQANIQKKKAQLMGMLNAQTSGQQLTVDKVQEIALNWMEIADKDGNGELDYQEFYDFFSKIEGVLVTDEEIKQIFNDFDGSGNGYLSVEEFARAIYQVVLADHDEYSDVDDYGMESENDHTHEHSD